MGRRVQPLRKAPLLGYYTMVRGGAISPPFDPTSISGLKLWIDFSDTSALFTDAGSTPVSSDGDAIYQANDKSGNGYHATQSNATYRPAYKTAIKNSLSVARSDGSDMFSLSPSSTSGSYTFFFVYSASDGSDDWLFDTQTGRLVLAHDYADAVSWNATVWRKTGAYQTGWQIITFHLVSGGNGTVYRNGSSIGSAAYAAKNIGGSSRLFGAYDSLGNNGIIGDFAEVIAYESALSDTDRQAVEAYLNNKWSIYEPAKTESLEGLLSFETEEEKLWWQGADVQADDILDKVEPQVTLTWWDKAKKYINDKLYQLWQAIEDYFDYHEED